MVASGYSGAEWHVVAANLTNQAARCHRDTVDSQPERQPRDLEVQILDRAQQRWRQPAAADQVNVQGVAADPRHAPYSRSLGHQQVKVRAYLVGPGVSEVEPRAVQDRAERPELGGQSVGEGAKADQSRAGHVPDGPA